MGPDEDEGENKIVSELPFTFSDLQVGTSTLKTTGRSVVQGMSYGDETLLTPWIFS